MLLIEKFPVSHLVLDDSKDIEIAFGNNRNGYGGI